MPWAGRKFDASTHSACNISQDAAWKYEMVWSIITDSLLPRGNVLLSFFKSVEQDVDLRRPSIFTLRDARVIDMRGG
jgi:hypothetical protein